VPTPGPAYGRATPNLRPTPASSILIDAQSILFVAAHMTAAKSACEHLTAIESALIDIRRESPRDTLRHPAGLNDTLIDMINTAAIADMAPTESTVVVSQETIARVDAQIANLDVLLNTDIVNINRMAAESSIAHIQTVI
jgi:hypothetical protein